ncbi:metallophosphoesterase family protein [Sphingomonas sp. RB3P16]|uniref:metallophosphoesterase family protein n=1 Tax=Parasphingomonas frigoris TaxID=3096163 RepID=UPI002FCA0C94
MLFDTALRRKPLSQLMPADERIYAIGDVHGRLDLLHQLLGKIEDDIAQRSPARNRIIVLGDFIDRGPDSARIASIFASRQTRPGLIVLKGNHEAALVDGIRGDRAALDLWIEHGGDATLRSFGASEDEIYPADSRVLLETVRRIIPKTLVKWMARLPLMYRCGGYLFVHAGIRPGVSLHKQTADDLLWIRDAFIHSQANHGAIIVHGHTVFETGVSLNANRIGVDTGACRTGRLSAVGLEGNARWVLDTGFATEDAL